MMLRLSGQKMVFLLGPSTVMILIMSNGLTVLLWVHLLMMIVVILQDSLSMEVMMECRGISCIRMRRMRCLRVVLKRSIS